MLVSQVMCHMRRIWEHPVQHKYLEKCCDITFNQRLSDLPCLDFGSLVHGRSFQTEYEGSW